MIYPLLKSFICPNRSSEAQEIEYIVNTWSDSASSELLQFSSNV